MEVVNKLLEFIPAPNGCVLAVGVFDGVHRGHREILAKARDAADAGGNELLVYSFAPGPREFFSGSDEGYYLLTLDEFKHELSHMGVDRLLLVPFDGTFREMHAGDFINEIVRSRLDGRTLVVGEDFAFGVGREGGIDFIQGHLAEIGLELIVVDELVDDGLSVRSTTIRKLIRTGEIEKANRLLGYRFYVSGEVITGSGIGKSMDYPTANILWPESKVKPLKGVYAVITELAGDKFHAVANFGVRPTFEGTSSEERFEVHLIDLDPGDLVGKSISVKFEAFLREEKKFQSPAELAAQITRDKQEAVKLLENIMVNERR